MIGISTAAVVSSTIPCIASRCSSSCCWCGGLLYCQVQSIILTIGIVTICSWLSISSIVNWPCVRNACRSWSYYSTWWCSRYYPWTWCCIEACCLITCKRWYCRLCSCYYPCTWCCIEWRCLITCKRWRCRLGSCYYPCTWRCIEWRCFITCKRWNCRLCSCYYPWTWRCIECSCFITC